MNKIDYLPYAPAVAVLLFPYWHYDKLQSTCSGFGFLFSGRSFVYRDWGDGSDLCSFGASLDMSMMLVCLVIASIVGIVLKKYLSSEK